MKTFEQYIKENLDGLAVGKSIKDFYNKYYPTKKISFDSFKDDFKCKVEEGISVEYEHTREKEIARKIALDHLWEDLNYYYKLKKFVEQAQKTAVISYGRFNPPTIAHEKLIRTLSETAKANNADAYLVPSHSDFYTAKAKVDREKNPLTLREKIKILSNIVPNNVIISSDGRTLINILKILSEQGYTNIIQLAGSDRIEEFRNLINKYNNVPDKRGIINFGFKGYELISSGDRDPDSEGTIGMSASKLRKLAREGNYEEFVKGMPQSLQSNESLLKEIYNIIRERSANK
jgi:nicotinic acid mononucleotide adenylyltransferase